MEYNQGSFSRRFPRRQRRPQKGRQSHSPTDRVSGERSRATERRAQRADLREQTSEGLRAWQEARQAGLWEAPITGQASPPAEVAGDLNNQPPGNRWFDPGGPEPGPVSGPNGYSDQRSRPSDPVEQWYLLPSSTAEGLFQFDFRHWLYTATPEFWAGLQAGREEYQRTACKWYERGLRMGVSISKLPRLAETILTGERLATVGSVQSPHSNPQ